jgi:hypothetical protein
VNALFSLPLQQQQQYEQPDNAHENAYMERMTALVFFFSIFMPYNLYKENKRVKRVTQVRAVECSSSSSTQERAMPYCLSVKSTTRYFPVVLLPLQAAAA